jgi:hypothetical protein
VNEADIFVGLAAKVADLCFDGKIPTNQTFFIATVLRAFVSESLPDAVKKNFAFNLAMATDALYRSQNAKWKN